MLNYASFQFRLDYDESVVIVQPDSIYEGVHLTNLLKPNDW